MILDVEATAAFTVATECRYDRTKGSKSPLATEGSPILKKGLLKSDVLERIFRWDFHYGL